MQRNRMAGSSSGSMKLQSAPFDHPPFAGHEVFHRVHRSARASGPIGRSPKWNQNSMVRGRVQPYRHRVVAATDSFTNPVTSALSTIINCRSAVCCSAGFSCRNAFSRVT